MGRHGNHKVSRVACASAETTTEKEMKRVLILVLSTDKPPYDTLYRASTETWDSEEVEGVETIFYFARTNYATNSPRVLFTDSDDDFFSMGRKTLAAFKYALENREFDYIFRANASLFVNKPGLLRYVQDRPTENLALGVVADCGNFEGDKHSFLWGPSYLLSRDVVEKVVEQQGHWKHRAMDDNAISMLLRDIGIPLDNRGSMASIALRNGGYEFTYYENGAGGFVKMDDLRDVTRRLPGQFAFRVKDDANRENDVRLMHELKEAFKV